MTPCAVKYRQRKLFDAFHWTGDRTALRAWIASLPAPITIHDCGTGDSLAGPDRWRRVQLWRGLPIMSGNDRPKESVYDAHITPLMTQVIALCKEHKINMAAQFALDPNDEGRVLFCTTCLPNVDTGDAEGAARMRALGAVMLPSPVITAFAIITGK